MNELATFVNDGLVKGIDRLVFKFRRKSFKFFSDFPLHRLQNFGRIMIFLTLVRKFLRNFYFANMLGACGRTAEIHRPRPQVRTIGSMTNVQFLCFQMPRTGKTNRQLRVVNEDVRTGSTENVATYIVAFIVFDIFRFQKQQNDEVFA